MPPVNVTRFGGSLADALRNPIEQLELYWLGQSGFLLRTRKVTWIIDPYLSNHLADKYRDHVFSHERMKPAPIAIEDLSALDYVFCTHIHGDHLDRPTLEAIAKNQSKTCFVLPGGIESEVSSLQIDHHRFIWAEADKSFWLEDEIEVVPVKAAHEDFEYDTRGRHRFLGYVFRCGEMTLYHSGDCIPYQGLAEKLRELRPDVALLPINGRSKELTEKKIIGNFSLAEAIELCLRAKIPAMMAQHFGMFAFNTIRPELIDQAALGASKELQILKAEVGTRYTSNSLIRA
jgi:L-ascorbate metabolism protein UlaG (beta-lactamase superfamily)